MGIISLNYIKNYVKQQAIFFINIILNNISLALLYWKLNQAKK